MSGTLTLVPTPIDDETLLLPSTKELLENAFSNNDLILLEEIKEGRRRWLRYGLPREAIETFVLYNEHTRLDILEDIIKSLKSNKNVFLMSDCGLPAFCDPGQKLVDRCHDLGIKVTATPFANSIALAIALSGFNHSRFIFEGFIPANKELRLKELKRILKQKEVSILMDTPYRLKKLLDEIEQIMPQRRVFLGLDLNQPTEELLRGYVTVIRKRLKDIKREFILILDELS